jgi:hypothetical protein
MIQRIQSVYLLLVTALLTSNIFLPIASFVDSKGVAYPLTPLHVAFPEAGLNYTPLGQLALLILSALIAFATIFLYKNRKLQIRMSVFNLLIMAGFYSVVLVSVIFLKSSSKAVLSPSFGLCLPLIAMILNYLAIRAIRKDDAMVKAADRIR